MHVTVDLDELAPLVEQSVERALAAHERPIGWLDAAGAAEHLAITEAAVRSLVQRREIPFSKLPNGRVRFRPEELDEWARSGS
jgi:excisionase family DNA binding protein